MLKLLLPKLARVPQLSSSPHIRKSLYSSASMKKQNRISASYYRGGTSRAIIFHQKDLPQDRKDWAPIFCGVIGSPDPNGRQLDGMGGGISSLSKVCVVGPPTHPAADVDYTFVAIGVKDSDVDYTANCGNMTSAIGPFAVDTGLVKVQDGDVTIKIHNTNTGKLIHSKFLVTDGEADVSGTFALDGVAGTTAKIELAFLDPAGSKTGKLLPTGNITDTFVGIKATCIDAGNPAVFIQASDIGVDGTILPEALDSDTILLSKLESIRRKAGVAMGLGPTEDSIPGSIPKIAMISKAASHKLLSGEAIDASSVDVLIRALSVGQPHRAVPLTLGLAAASAANLKGSIVHSNVATTRVDPDGVTLGHPSGKMMVGSKFNDQGTLTQGIVFRTARRLMEGQVYWK